MDITGYSDSWEFLNKYKKIPKNKMRNVIKESWRRCLENKLDPQKLLIKRISDEELIQRREKHSELLSTAQPIMRKLFEFIRGSGSVVVLTDEDGIVLDSFGDSDFAMEIDIANTGVSWNEASMGTNGVGTALVTRKPIQIRGTEHFWEKNHLFTCSACVIHNSNNEIIGCIDISSRIENVHLHTLGMVVAAADSIEQQLILKKTIAENREIYEKQSAMIELIDVRLIAIDENFKITTINSSVLKDIKMTNEQVLKKDIRYIIYEGIDFEKIATDRQGFLDKETVLKVNNSVIRCNLNAAIICNNKKFKGAVFTYKTKSRILKVINKMTGSQAYFEFSDIIGNSPLLKKCIDLGKICAKSNSNVLLIGESGTGKELFAQAIHNCSARSEAPFIAVNCGALPRELIQSELFGYESGAFTGSKKEGHTGKFELANGGTIFLDEIGDMPLDAQVNLLRVLESREVVRIGGKYPKRIDVKIIAATNKNLFDEMQKGSFREDLYYRLNVLTINIPPLRERDSDVKLLVKFFTKKYAKQMDKNIDEISENVFNILSQYNWPGNIRELENVIERAVNIADKPRLSTKDLPYSIVKKCCPVFRIKSDSLIQEKEAKIIEDILKKNNGNIRKSAVELGVVRSTLYHKIKKYNIKIENIRIK